MVRSLSVFRLLKTTPKSARAAVLGLFAGLAVGIAGVSAAPEYTGPHRAGKMTEPKNEEASGLAASRRTPGVLWTHNDSGGEPVLFAMNPDGALRGKVRVDGATNHDWEDVTCFELDGQAWLIAADIGDNYALRPGGCTLYVLPEPDVATLAPDREAVVTPVYTINFVYEDGPRDAESLAVDLQERAIYLLSKRDTVARLYRLPLGPVQGNAPAVAKFVGLVPHLPKPTLLQQPLNLPTQRLVGWPTAMGFSPDGTLALVLVYGQPLLFPRAPGESWPEALAREPVKLAPPELPQAEGACFSLDGKAIFVNSEKTMDLLRYDRVEPAPGLPADRAPVPSKP
jgi:hypothetical protein